MSGERYTLDANVVFNALDFRTGDKHRIAVSLMKAATSQNCVFTTQTLAETYNAVTKRRPDLALAARQWVEQIARHSPVISASVDDVLEAAAIHERRPVHFWDALLWATARRHGCTTILTEDAQDRPLSGGVRYLNPFETPADPDLAAFLS